MNALKEVSMQESETPWMFDEYRYILDNADQIKKVTCRRGNPSKLKTVEVCLLGEEHGEVYEPLMKEPEETKKKTSIIFKGWPGSTVYISSL